MDLLKELSTVLSKVLEPVFGNPRVCAIAFLGLALLLALPASWLVPVGLDVVQAQYKWVVGLLWFVFGLALVYHLVEFADRKRREIRMAIEIHEQMQAGIERLTEGQKDILRQFVVEPERKVLVDEDLRGLTRAGILIGHVTELDQIMRSYETVQIDPWAGEYLKQHPELLAPARGRSRRS